MAVQLPTDAAAADALLASSDACVANFCAAWAEPCAHLNAVFAEFPAEHKNVVFVQLDADAFPDLCERFGLESVPAFIFLRKGIVADTLVGADVLTLVNKVKQHDLTASIAAGGGSGPAPSGMASGGGSGTADAASPVGGAMVPLEERLRALTHKAPVVLFMKGTPDAPRCGFSRTAVGLLQEAQVRFDTFDILSDEEVRQGLKKYSNWPTYPQLYGDGKLVGGLDIMKELQEEGELVSSLPAAAKMVPLEERLRTLTHKAPVVLFMKGTPDAPRCGFSRTAVGLLQEAQVRFDTFDILSDEEVRQGLKKYSNWPTYPQLYGDGKLVGGLDIMKELQEEGELVSSLPAAAVQVS